MSSVIDTTTTEVAILMDDHVDKYNPGTQTFRLQSINGLQQNTRTLETTQVELPFLMNADPSAIKLSEVKKAAVIKLPLPREITRNFPKKFIPVGTRFIVSFNSGDITKPVIVGREDNDK